MTNIRTADFDCWYTDECFADPWVSAEAIVIQHGFGRNGDYWRPWVPDLARERRVIRRDMRGHGGSGAGLPDHTWSIESLAQDVCYFLDALGLEKVHYIGESIGGVTGVVLGACYSERLLSLTLISTPLHLGNRLDTFMRGDYPNWSSALRALGPSGWIATRIPGGSIVADWQHEQWARCDPDSLASLAAATLNIDVEAYLPRVSVPTLILAPSGSPLAPLDEQLCFNRSIAGSQIYVIETDGHDIYLTDRDRCISRILAFFDHL